MKIVVCIPAFNEARTIGKVLEEIHSVMKDNRYNYIIQVVDDGSTDPTAKIAEDMGAKVYRHHRNCGLAETFRMEMKYALENKADVIVHTDADGQYLATDIPRLINELQKGYDMVLGSRFRGRIESMPLIKKLGNRAFSKVLSSITGVRVTDGQTGFRAFKAEVARDLEIKSTFTYTQEQIIRAAKMKYRMKEIPIFFARRGGKTKSRLMKGPFDYALRASVNIFRIYRDYEPLKFFGAIGGIFFGMGSLLSGYIVLHWIATGSVGAMPRVVLAMLLLLTGIQIGIFGFLADMFRKAA